MEVEAAIDAAVCALLDAFRGTRSAEAESPILELPFVLGGELRGTGDVGGFADDLVTVANLLAEGVIEACLDEADGEVGDVDADQRRLSFCATCTVVPQPQKGSSTTSPRGMTP